MVKSFDDKTELDYESTKSFFSTRAKKYDEKHPYVPTSYQDANPELTELRNNNERKIIEPLLSLNVNSKVVDIGCGVGRWAENILPVVGSYLGLDFSQELLDIATKRLAKYIDDGRAEFQQCAFQELNEDKFSTFTIKPPYTCGIISGVLIYVNDADIIKGLNNLAKLMDNSSVIYIREPISLLDTRMTLSNHYSEELNSDYSALYRPIDEYLDIFNSTLIKHGFNLEHQGNLLNKETANRKETSQNYFILRR